MKFYCLLLSFCLLQTHLLYPDVVYLKNGQELHGKVEKKQELIRIVMPTGSLTLPKSMVQKIVYKKSLLDKYRQHKNALENGTILEKENILNWAKNHKRRLGEKILQDIIQHILDEDPQNEKALLELARINQRKADIRKRQANMRERQVEVTYPKVNIEKNIREKDNFIPDRKISTQVNKKRPKGKPLFRRRARRMFYLASKLRAEGNLKEAAEKVRMGRQYMERWQESRNKN